jgi:hypothetical protein
VVITTQSALAPVVELVVVLADALLPPAPVVVDDAAPEVVVLPSEPVSPPPEPELTQAKRPAAVSAEIEYRRVAFMIKSLLGTCW